MSKRLWIILGVIAAVLVGFLLLRGDDQANAPSDNGNTGEALHVRGNAESNVVLTEYADFQCPYCAAFNPVVEQVFEKYQNDVRFEFRNLPLSSAHPNAFAAARAAEATSLQNEEAYWAMVNILFENQQTWASSSDPKSLFQQYAQQLNLDIERFNEDFASAAVNDRINADMDAFRATGAEMSTPTFFLNGEKITLAEGTLEEFSTYIDEALKNASQQNNTTESNTESSEQ